MLKVAMHRFLSLDFPTRAASDLDPRTGRASQPRSARRTRAWPREHAHRATASAAFVRAIFMNHDRNYKLILNEQYWMCFLPVTAGCGQSFSQVSGQYHIINHSDCKAGRDWSNFRISPTLSHRR